MEGLLFSTLLVIGCAFSANAALSAFQWSDCGSDQSFTLQNVAVHPMPVVLPGNITLSIKASTTRKQLNQMRLQLSVKRDTFLLNVPIPCIAHVGSCTYDDTCTLLATMQRENWAGVMGDLGGQIQAMLASAGITNYCPATVQNIDIQNYVLQLPPVPSVLSWFAEGDYEAKVQAFDTATGTRLLCVSLKLTIEEKKAPCTGWFCGRRRRHQ